MLSIMIRRNISLAKLKNFRGSMACNHHTLSRNNYETKNLILQSLTSNHVIVQRNLSETERDVTLPKLLPDYSGTGVWYINYIPDLLIFYFAIRPFIDPDLNLEEITAAAKHAILVVSCALANKDYNFLNEIVDDTLLQQLKVKVNSLSEKERELIAIQDSDIMRSSRSNLTWNYKSNSLDSDVNYIIELGMRIHYMPGLGKFKNMVNNLSNNPSNNTFRLPSLCVANYTLERVYRNKIGSPWIIKYLNHASVH